MVKIKTHLFFLSLSILISFSLGAQRIMEGQNAESVISGAEMVRYVDGRTAPDFVRLRESSRFDAKQSLNWLKNILNFRDGDNLVLKKSEPDQLGMVHFHYDHYFQGVHVEHSGYKVHTLGGQVVSVNGQFYNNFNVSVTPSVSATAAIGFAKAHIGADSYKWELDSEENFIKEETGDPNATFAPQPTLVIISKNADYEHQDFRLAWKMDIYAQEPMSRHHVYVDAQTGEIIWKEDKICHVDVVGSGATGYSGTRNFTTDYNGSTYRLRESGRGNGIITRDLNNGTNYGNAVEFTDSDNDWVNLSPAIDHYALDAHWGAEMTYDYFLTVHNRNSIDGNGFNLLSYVHYGNAYDNAFWDGQRMTYGDGGSYFTSPLTSLDITGHEIGHGLTSNTANLVYQNEPGALNESFSDIFGVCIDNWARGTTGNLLWRIGDECRAGLGIRKMDDPNVFGDPDTYLGTNWYTGTGDNGGVHWNSGVQNFWFYLLSSGGTGTNDLGNAYNVTGIGMLNASRVAFRNLTVYLGVNSNYNDARFYAIQAANDLFGGCSPEVIATTNAWYAVGVGPVFSATVTAGFTAPSTSFCVVPALVSFNNSSTNASNFTWHFGDGNTSSASNPSHTYTQEGTYTIKLVANGGICGTDSVTQTSYIVVDAPDAPVAQNLSICDPQSVTVNASGTGTINWYATPNGQTPFFTGTSYTTPLISSNTTYYLENVESSPAQYLGPVNNSFGTGGQHNNNSIQYLEFTVNSACTLVSAWVNAGGNGSRTIELWDANGVSLDTRTLNISQGTGRITLNFTLTPGTYRIGGTFMNLYRNMTGAQYPYSISGLASITGSSAGSAFYYYLYDWELQEEPCISPRVPVDILYGTTPVANFTSVVNGAQVVFTDQSSNGITYNWDFGDGSNSNLQNPTHTYQANGTYTVTLIVTNNGCSDTIVREVVIQGLAIQQEGNVLVEVYPNPFDQFVQVKLELPQSGDLQINAYNAIGQLVRNIYSGQANAGKSTFNWDNVKGLPAGVYFIHIDLNGTEISKKLVKI